MVSSRIGEHCQGSSSHTSGLHTVHYCTVHNTTDLPISDYSGGESTSYKVFFMRVVLYTNNARKEVPKNRPLCILVCLSVGIFQFVKYVIVFDEIWVWWFYLQNISLRYCLLNRQTKFDISLNTTEFYVV